MVENFAFKTLKVGDKLALGKNEKKYLGYIIFKENQTNIYEKLNFDKVRNNII